MIPLYHSKVCRKRTVCLSPFKIAIADLIADASFYLGLPLSTVNEIDSKVVLALTRHGGHIGFLAGFLPTRPNLMDRAVPQFVSAVFEHKDDFKEFNCAKDAVDGDCDGNREENKIAVNFF